MNVDRGGFEPPTSPSLDFFAKGLDGSDPYPTELDYRPKWESPLTLP